MFKIANLLLFGTVCLFCSCTTIPDKDYTTFRKLQPKSILVLPPIHNDFDERASYSYLSTISSPLAERGYYVFPVAVIDHFLKENGLPMPEEMHQIPLKKIDEIIGADAVLYIVIEEYGTDYQILSSNTTVSVNARLVDVRTGQDIWEGKKQYVQSSSAGSGGIIEMLVAAIIGQIVNNSTDTAHDVSGIVNYQLITEQGQGLLYGSRHELFGMDEL